MTTAKPKPAIAYGLFFSARGESDAYLFRMKVTSFSINHSGTKMAHGSHIPEGNSCHRKAEEMHFYGNESAMEDAIRIALINHRTHQQAVDAALRSYQLEQREQRKSVQAALNLREIPQSELFTEL